MQGPLHDMLWWEDTCVLIYCHNIVSGWDFCWIIKHLFIHQFPFPCPRHCMLIAFLINLFLIYFTCLPVSICSFINTFVYRYSNNECMYPACEQCAYSEKSDACDKYSCMPAIGPLCTHLICIYFKRVAVDMY